MAFRSPISFTQQIFLTEAMVPFGHALKLVLGTKGQLEILHVDREEKRADWDNYSSVRETLCRWKVLPEGAQ